MKDISENIKFINQQIKAVCVKADIDINKVNLVAVSKTKPATDIIKAINCGQKIFGENKIQEAKQKWLSIKEQHKNIKLHLIGHLQTNKVKDAVKLFDVIETIDSKKLVDAILELKNKSYKIPELFIQVNIAREPQKYGVDQSDLEALVRYMKESNLPLTGLMCIPPLGKDPVKYFVMLREYAAKFDLPYLSMGMSSDYKEAIICGATHIRVGTAIFGSR